MEGSLRPPYDGESFDPGGSLNLRAPSCLLPREQPPLTELDRRDVVLALSPCEHENCAPPSLCRAD